MSLKFKYILFIGLLHTVLVLLTYQILRENKWIFIASEFIIMISLYLSYLLYMALIKPIDLMQTGADAIRDKDFTIKYLKTGSSEVDKLVTVYNAMIDKLREERTSMSEQSYFLQKIMDVSPLGILICDFDEKITLANPAAKKLLRLPKYEEGKTFTKIDNPIVQAIQNLDFGEAKVISINGIDKYKCQVSEVVHQGYKRKFYIVDDLSTELIQSEKEAFGRIIRMMAHEVNNSMGAVNSIIDTVVEYGFEDAKDEEYKESLTIARDRNQALAKFMDNYASILRLPEPTLKLKNLSSILKKCGQLFVPIANEKGIKIHFELAKEPVQIKVDNILLEQAISNIIKNAIEAIEGPGNIYIRSHSNPKGFTIADDGIGIPEKLKHKLFTPFFSTKPTGQGVGLMLIRDILQLHKASFSLKTNKEHGLTQFEVRL